MTSSLAVGSPAPAKRAPGPRPPRRALALALVLATACNSAGGPCAVDEDCPGDLHCVPVDACPGGDASGTDGSTMCCNATVTIDGPDAADLVEGNLIQFEDNGGWCWYQDPRVLIDVTANRMVVGSVANHLGYGGQPRDADVNASGFDLATGDRTRFLLRNVPAWGMGDDHNAPAFQMRPDGRILAMYTGHNEESRETWYRISEPHDPSTWGPEQTFSWGAPGGGLNVTYTNLFRLSAEGRTYNIAREIDRSPHIAVSDDDGTTWRREGRLTAPRLAFGYSNGYFRFATNGVDRIDFIATEHHPRDYNTGIFHGYIHNGQSFDSHGALIDDDIFDAIAPSVEAFTQVFVPDIEDGIDDDTEYHRAWTTDIAYMANGRPHILFTTRYGTAAWPASLTEPEYRGSADHRLFHARFDGNAWRTLEVARMGRQLYDIEQDYTGLGALDPDDDTTFFFSSPVDPRDGAALPHREIFRAVIDADSGFMFTPLTWQSGVDNARPVVPRWSGPNRALLFWRGTYETQFDYDTSIVGVLERSETMGMTTYVDAGATNTRQADGAPLSRTGPDPSPGPPDNAWHHRTVAAGNDNDVLATDELGAEDAPTLMTTVHLPAAGTYEIFVFFWSNPAEDWRIAAGLTLESMSVFRRRGTQHVRARSFDAPVVVLQPTVSLYRAYVGRVTVDAARAVDVYVDDAPADGIPAGDNDGTERTWYDGVGFAHVE